MPRPLKWQRMYEHKGSFGVYAFWGALLNKRLGFLVACAQHASHGASVCPAPKCFQEDMDRGGRWALRISGPTVPHPASIWYCTKEPFYHALFSCSCKFFKWNLFTFEVLNID